MEMERRNDIINRLSSIKYWAYLTYLSSEMCLEVTTFTSEGVVQEWVGEDDWQIYKLKAIESSKWGIIKQKLEKEELTLEVIKDTDLVRLLKSYYGEENGIPYNCSNILTDLNSLPSIINNAYYCYITYDGCFHFYSNEDNLADDLAKEKTGNVEKWEDMSDDELNYWYEMYENEDHEIPCFSFED